MNKQLLRLKKRSDDTVLQVAECDDSDNLYVHNYAPIYGIEKENDTMMPVSLTDEGSLWTKNIQDVTTLEDTYRMTWPDGAAQYTGYEHVYTLPADYVYDKHYIYVANPSPDTALQLSVRNGVPMFGSQLYGQIYNVAVPAASYTAFSDVAWSSCFTSIGGALVDESGDLNDILPPGNDVPFTFGAVNDAIYFGATGPFQRVRINTGTAGVYNASGVWEYWNGAAWAACPYVYDESSSTVTDGTKSFTRTGSRYIQWQIPDSWVPYDIAGDPTSQYWVRWRITSFTGITVGPALSSGTYKRTGAANVHGYLVEGLFNGDDIKITLENNTAVTYGFPAEIFIRSV